MRGSKNVSVDWMIMASVTGAHLHISSWDYKRVYEPFLEMCSVLNFIWVYQVHDFFFNRRNNRKEYFAFQNNGF